MEAFNQYIVYKLVPRANNSNKTDKLPVDYRTGFIANAHDPSIWTTHALATFAAGALGDGYGIGFVFTAQDPFWFLDIDDCLVDGAWSPLALQLLGALAGCYVEVSASGRGLHIIGSGSPPPHSCRNGDHKLEFYTSGRFVALTNTYASGSADHDPGAALTWLIDQYFSNQVAAGPHAAWTTEPIAGWRGPTSDDELIRRALQSTSAAGAFDGKARFRDLWEASPDALARTYPDPVRAYDESSADAALAQHLAFWTGNNCERIATLMRRSALARDKWDREDYLPRTIVSACGRQKVWCVDRENKPSISTDKKQRIAVPRGSFLSPEHQAIAFAGCVYVLDEHKVLTPEGVLLKPEQFAVKYAGCSMSLGGDNTKTTRNAWEAFTLSQVNLTPMADSTCFRPDIERGAIITDESRTLVNVWVPVDIKYKEGDPAPFLEHVAKLCPDIRDQWILLSYMAAIVQHQGVKFQWCPVIQGVEGNGKTLLSRCLEYAVGKCYSHTPKAAELASKFNDWLYRKIFISVEDIYVPHERLEIMEAIKPMITSYRQEIEPKGGAKVTREVCANFVVNTNHKDGLRKTPNDRRFAPFYTAQQCTADLERDGMDEHYFVKLYKWLGTEGYDIVYWFLKTYEIPTEFNPHQGCVRAPKTSSTDNAISHGTTYMEQDIQEMIDQQLPGFRNGWVSSMALDRLLEKQQAARRYPQNKRRELMQSVGYDWHPNLPGGRAITNIMPDNGRPRLYIHRNSPHIALQRPSQIERQYTVDQL